MAPDEGSLAEDLASSEERFKLLVENVRDYAIFMLDPGGRIVTWNVGAERIKGYRADGIIGKHFSVFYPPEDIASHKPGRELEGAAADGRFEDEGWRLRKDGTRFWANVVLTTLRDAGGALRGFAKVTRDLTEQKRAEDALRQTSASLAATLLSIGDAVIATDAGGGVTLMNTVAEGLTGWPSAEARGRPIADVFHIINEDTRLPAVNPIDRVIREGVVVGLANHTALIARGGPTRPIADSGAPIRGADGAFLGTVLVFRDITEQREQEERLRESEERLRLLVENVEDYAIFMIDLDGRVASWNQGAARIKGYSSEEILGQHVSVFFPPEARDQAVTELEMARRDGRFAEEGWRVRKDGTRFWASAVVTAVRDTTGTLHGYAKVTRDLTASRAAEQIERSLIAERAGRAASEASERKLAVILATVVEGITVQDESGALLFANDAAARVCGLSTAAELIEAARGDLLARFDMLDEEGRPFTADKLPGRQVFQGVESPVATVRVRERRTGREFWSKLMAAPVRDAEGRIVLSVIVWHDVTEERRGSATARFLADASALLATALDRHVVMQRVAEAAVPTFADWTAVDVVEDGRWRRVAVAHRDPEKVRLAAEIERRYPVDPAAVRGAPQVARTGRAELYADITDEMLVARTVDAEHLRIARSLQLRSAIVVPLVSRGRILGTLTLIHAESGRHYDQRDLAVAEDLGRRAGLALDNSRLYEEAREAVNLRDDFLSIAGHELKTPLAALMLQVGGLERIVAGESVDVPRIRDRVDKMARHCRRLERLIDELLDVTRLTSRQLTLVHEPLDLAALVADVLDRFADELAAAKCPLEYHGESARGEWDRFRLDQLVTNLLGNAIKYGRGKPITVRVRLHGDRAELTVRDRGIGIAREAQERIFDRFERAVSERNFGGLGLGLWIARQTAEVHGGKIRVESEQGAGAEFIVELPCRRAAR